MTQRWARLAGWLFGTAVLCAPAPGTAQQKGDAEAAIAFLATLQEVSIRRNREFCGYFLRGRDGGLQPTPPTRGRAEQCLADEPEPDAEIVASYHTHGGYDPEIDSEVPSTDDVMGDRDEQVDGYISTPGGRVWFHDWETGAVWQLCGLACVPADPEHSDDAFEPVPQRTNLIGLIRRFDEG